MRENRYSQTATLEAPATSEHKQRDHGPMPLVGAVVAIIVGIALIVGHDVIFQAATIFAWIMMLLAAMLVLVAAFVAVVWLKSWIEHKSKMQDLERQHKEAEIEAARMQAKTMHPDAAGNYPAVYEERYSTFVQAQSGNIIQPVPQTYSPHYAPHITYHNQQQTGEKPDASTSVQEITADFPTMEEIYSSLRENALEVCLGRSKSTGELFTMPLVEGTHYRIIGGSGFGKSCFAGAILDMTTAMNDEDHLQIALLDLEHKTSRLFEKLPHIAQIQVGRRWIDCVASEPDEVAEHLGYLKKELDRRKALSEYDLRRERFMLIYVEEFLSLKREVDPKLLEEMAAHFTILAARGRKYGMHLLACAQVDYADKQFRDAMNQFNVNASFSVKPSAAQAVGFVNHNLLKQNFAAKQKGQFVLETTGCTDIMLAPQYDVKKMLLQLERSSYVHSAVQPQLLNEPRTVPERDENGMFERSSEVLRLYSMGWGKQAIIEKVWSVKKGGSERYKQAESEYNTIMSKQEV